MGDLLVECPIHLDAVSIQDILVFKCGHGFCEPCLEEHVAHHRQSGFPLSCPTCRQHVRRKDAFPLFLAPAQPGSSGSSSQPEAAAASQAHTRLIRELREAKAARVTFEERFADLREELDSLRQRAAYRDQTIQHLRDRHELLEGRLAKEVDNAVRAKEESSLMKEEIAKLQAENLKSSKALEEALREGQAQADRVKKFKGFLERYRHQCNLEKKKRKAIENANRQLEHKREDDSLMVVDSNAPDTLRQDVLDYGWLDGACEVKGDPLTTPSDDDMYLQQQDSEDEVQHGDHDTKGKQKEVRVPGSSLKFPSEWNIGPESLPNSLSGDTRKRSRQVGASRIIKVKMPVGGTHKSVGGGPLAIDRQGRIKGAVALGPRQKFNSKN